ncbi:MAG: hypothetical protein WCP34_13430, partial [Pseudomonadota bacterium]
GFAGDLANRQGRTTSGVASVPLDKHPQRVENRRRVGGARAGFGQALNQAVADSIWGCCGGSPEPLNNWKTYLENFMSFL